MPGRARSVKHAIDDGAHRDEIERNGSSNGGADIPRGPMISIKVWLQKALLDLPKSDGVWAPHESPIENSVDRGDDGDDQRGNVHKALCLEITTEGQ